MGTASGRRVLAQRRERQIPQARDEFRPATRGWEAAVVDPRAPRDLAVLDVQLVERLLVLTHEGDRVDEQRSLRTQRELSDRLLGARLEPAHRTHFALVGDPRASLHSQAFHDEAWP